MMSTVLPHPAVLSSTPVVIIAVYYQLTICLYIKWQQSNLAIEQLHQSPWNALLVMNILTTDGSLGLRACRQESWHDLLKDVSVCKPTSYLVSNCCKDSTTTLPLVYVARNLQSGTEYIHLKIPPIKTLLLSDH